MLSLQIEQEMDLVLSKRDSFKQALQSWKDIWVPTLLEYGSHLHENIYDSAQKMFEGILVVALFPVPAQFSVACCMEKW